MRQKLIAAGVAVSAGSAMSGAVVANASAASASIGSSTGAAGAGTGVAAASVGAKLAGLSLSAKISAGIVVLASASALSVYDAGERSSRTSARERVREAAVAAAPAPSPAAHAVTEPAAIEPSAIAAPTPTPIAGVAAPARLRSEARRARVGTTQSAPATVTPVLEEPIAAPTPQAPVSASLPSALRAEAELLERALSALHAGELESARRALSAHAERFPQGALRRERERAHQQLTLLVATRTDR